MCRSGNPERTPRGIDADLGISPQTMHTHFERLHHTLGATD